MFEMLSNYTFYTTNLRLQGEYTFHGSYFSPNVMTRLLILVSKIFHTVLWQFHSYLN